MTVSGIWPPSDSAVRRDVPPLLMVGLDHRTAPIDLREKVAYDLEATEDLLVALVARPAVAEAFVVSTCNRTEVYVTPHDEAPAFRAALELGLLARASEIEDEGRFYVKRGLDAARHILAVAAGIESMVLGEAEILGQVREAAALADRTGASGTLLRRLLRFAAAAGRRVRRETAIGAGAVSVGYAAVELAESIFQDLRRRTALLVGAGDVAHQVGRNLADRGVARLVVVNRDSARGRRLAERLPQAEPRPLEELAELLPAADLIVATTAAREALLDHAELERAMARRASRPLLVLDLGVPRNVDPAAADVENLFLHSLDSLKGLIARNLERRRGQVPAAERILDEELAQFRRWLRSLEVEPVVAALQRRAEGIRRQELARLRDRFPPETHDELERLTRTLVRRILHHPSTQLRSPADGAELPRLDLVRELFQLDPADAGEDEER